MVEIDYLVCGVCYTKFPLPAIVNFLQHKKFDCEDQDVASTLENRLMCQSCPRQFGSPWGLLKHAQNVHALRIYLEQGDFSPGIKQVQVITETPQQLLFKESTSQGKSVMQLVTNQVLGSVPIPRSTTSCHTVTNDNSIIKSLSLVNTKPAITGQLPTLIQGVMKSAIPPGGGFNTTQHGSRVIVGEMTTGGQKNQLGLTNMMIDVPNAPKQLNNRDSVCLVSASRPSPSLVQSAAPQSVAVASSTKLVNTTSVPANNIVVGECSFQKQPVLDAVVQLGETPENTTISSQTVANKSTHAKNLSTCENTTGLIVKPQEPIKCMSEIGTQTLSTSETHNTNSTEQSKDASGKTSIRECGQNPKPCCGNTECECEEPCCDNLDCGITVMPVTHEKPKKCCNAVVPKKRKRHMETKHGPTVKSFKKCAHPQNFGSEGGTIFIDLEPSADFMHDSTQPLVDEGATSSGDVTEGSSPNYRLPQQEHSVIIHPGSTLSIPVSYPRNSFTSSRQSILTVSHAGLPAAPKGNSRQDSFSSKAATHNSESSIPTSSVWVTSSIPASEQIESTNVEETPLMESLIKAKMLEQNVDHSSTDGKTTEILLNSSGKTEISPGENMTIEAPKTSEAEERQDGGVLKKRRYPTSRPYKCDKCDRAFNQRIHLKKHQSKHTGEKPFKCNQCTYSTVEKSHLKVHIRVHTGEKPFKCTFCGYATAQNSTLKIHLKRHHSHSSSGDLSCPTCGKHFSQPESLTNHTLQHQTNHGQADSGEATLDDGQLVSHTQLYRMSHGPADTGQVQLTNHALYQHTGQVPAEARNVAQDSRPNQPEASIPVLVIKQDLDKMSQNSLDQDLDQNSTAASSDLS